MAETLLVGMSFRKSTARPVGQVRFVREPENPVDKRAVAVYFNETMIGYLKKDSEVRDFVLQQLESGTIPKGTESNTSLELKEKMER